MAKLLEYNITAAIAFSTYRGGGVGCYGGFNITSYCGDTPEHVAACREELCRQLGITDDRLILPFQTHSDKVEIIDDGFLRLDKEEQKEALNGVDAVVTALHGTCIGSPQPTAFPCCCMIQSRMS